MKKISREELIEKLIHFRVLKHNSTIFVNVVSQTSTHCFTCEIEKLDYELDKRAFTELSILTNATIKGDELLTDAYFTELSFDNNVVTGVLSDGKIIRSSPSDFDFDYFIPKKEELKKMILRNIEEF